MAFELAGDDKANQEGKEFDESHGANANDAVCKSGTEQCDFKLDSEHLETPQSIYRLSWSR